MFSGKTMKKSVSCKRIGTRREVMNGSAVMTNGGLTKKKLVLSHGRIRTRAGISKGKKNEWAMAMKKARSQLKVKGFVPMKKGSALYKQTMKNYKK